jgi:hypothetical protein
MFYKFIHLTEIYIYDKPFLINVIRLLGLIQASHRVGVTLDRL